MTTTLNHLHVPLLQTSTAPTCCVVAAGELVLFRNNWPAVCAGDRFPALAVVDSIRIDRLAVSAATRAMRVVRSIVDLLRCVGWLPTQPAKARFLTPRRSSP